MDDFFGAGGIAVLATVVLVVLLELSWRLVGEPRGWPHEVFRKGHHVGFGLMAGTMPFAFHSGIMAAVVTLGFGLFLLVTFWLRILGSFYDFHPKQTDRPALRQLKHSWIGAVTYSVAVAILSALFWAKLPIYYGSLMILALGDAAATAVGTRYGRHYYYIFGTRRSLQGNLALLTLASGICALTLAWPAGGAGVPAERLWIVAVLFGLLLCLSETISPFGLDNLTLPLMTAAIMVSLQNPKTGQFDLTTETVVAFTLVGVTALLFTMAQLIPACFDGAALSLGISIVLLVDLGRYWFVTVLLIFLACTLLANALALRQNVPSEGPIRRRVGLDILGQVAPCMVFILLSRAVQKNIAVGSVACVIVLGGRWWASVFQMLGQPHPLCALMKLFRRTDESTDSSRSNALLGLRMFLMAVISFTAAWGAILGSSVIGYVWSMTTLSMTILTMVVAAVAGGFLSYIFVEVGTDAAAEPASSPWVQVVPGMLAVSALPAVRALVTGMIG